MMNNGCFHIQGFVTYADLAGKYQAQKTPLKRVGCLYEALRVFAIGD